MMTASKPKTIVVISQCTRGGSWRCIRELLDHILGKNKLRVVSLGNESGMEQIDTHTNWRSFCIPYPNFDEGWGEAVSSNTAYTMPSYLPLIAVSSTYVTFKRPNVIIANGLALSMAMAPLAKLLNIKIVCDHNGVIEDYVNPRWYRLLRKFTSLIDLILVNSQLSYDDMTRVASPEKIIKLDLVADPYYFQLTDRDNIRKEMKYEGKFVIFFAGRIDSQKNCDMLFEVIEAIGSDPRYLFLFAGVGEHVDKVKEYESRLGNVRYLGYLSDRQELGKYYHAADLTWTYGDESYVAKPGIESLAAGTPIILPDTPAIPKKKEQGKKVRKDVIPVSVGWIMDGSDQKSMIEIIRTLMVTRSTDSMRAEARRYAYQFFSNRESEYARVREILGL